TEQPVRELNEDARAVARQRVGAHRPAMGEIMQNLDAMGQNPVAFAIFDMRNEADAAGIMLVARIVESWPRLHPSTTPFSTPLAADTSAAVPRRRARLPRTASGRGAGRVKKYVSGT